MMETFEAGPLQATRTSAAVTLIFSSCFLHQTTKARTTLREHGNTSCKCCVVLPWPNIQLSCSVTLEKREPFFGKTFFSGAATHQKKKNRKRGKRVPLTNCVKLMLKPIHQERNIGNPARLLNVDPSCPATTESWDTSFWG